MRKLYWIIIGILALLLIGILTYSNSCSKSCGTCEVKIIGLKIFEEWKECPLSVGGCAKDSDCPQTCPMDTVAVCSENKCICGNTYPVPIQANCTKAQDCYPPGVSPGTDGGLFYQCENGKCYEGSTQRSAP